MTRVLVRVDHPGFGGSPYVWTGAQYEVAPMLPGELLQPPPPPPPPPEPDDARLCPWCKRRLTKRRGENEFKCRTCGWKGVKIAPTEESP